MFSANSSQVSEDRLYVEDVFSTYLYSGTSGAQSINNGIDTLNKGGLVWMKNRGSALNHILIDTAQGCTFAGGKNLISNSTNAAGTIAANTFQFDSTGFSFGSAASGGAINASGNTYASWTFRKAPKFFDVVTYTGDGATSRNISHSLGVAPGFIVIKKTSSTGDWIAYHRSIGTGNKIYLNYTNGSSADADAFATVTSTTFSVSTGTGFNDNGATYVAYLFAHDTTSDGIIQCGSFTTDAGGNFSVSLGWEPQFVMAKRTDAAQNWFMADTMRGFSQTQFNTLNPNLSNAEAANSSNYIAPNATGFGSIGNQFLSGSASYIYIAIRRGPMRTPTLGTAVFSPVLQNGGSTVTTNFVTDLSYSKAPGNALAPPTLIDRLRGGQALLQSSDTSAEASANMSFASNTGYVDSTFTSVSRIYWNFRRAPSFFDEVCYTGTGSAGVRAIPHNLGVAPELIISKFRNKAGENWQVYAAPLGATKYLYLNTTDASATYNMWGNTSPTSTNFYVQTDYTNQSGYNFVTYLFASCPGVSKVGSYTGNGSSQTINCGFAAGARFVMIKRTDSTGNWLVADSARGIVAGNDPLLYLNSTAAEVTSLDWIDADSSGFVVNQDSTANANVNGATYIYLAVA